VLRKGCRRPAEPCRVVSRRGVVRCLSCMRRKVPVQFLGEGVRVTSPPYPTRRLRSRGRAGQGASPWPFGEARREGSPPPQSEIQDGGPAPGSALTQTGLSAWESGGRTTELSRASRNPKGDAGTPTWARVGSSGGRTKERCSCAPRLQPCCASRPLRRDAQLSSVVRAQDRRLCRCVEL